MDKYELVLINGASLQGDMVSIFKQYQDKHVIDCDVVCLNRPDNKEYTELYDASMIIDQCLYRLNGSVLLNKLGNDLNVTYQEMILECFKALEESDQEIILARLELTSELNAL